jgi:hypothetical protein
MKTAIAWFTVALLALSGCYSFTGSSVPAHLKTVAIPLFEDQSGAGEPSLREKITNKLIERFRQDNSLEVADRNRSDAVIEGIILSMPDQPQVVTTGETVSKRRLTLSVKVTYEDLKFKKKIFEKEFTAWGDYESGGGPAQRVAGIDAAIDKLAEDILLAAVAGW